MKNLLTSPLGCVAPYIPALRKAMIRFAHPTPFLKWGSYGADDKLDYWDLFEVEELPHAPAWDGHMPEDVTRLLSLLSDSDD